MSKILALTGVTSKKSGYTLLEELSKNIDVINSMFPDGIRVLARATSDLSSVKRLLPSAEIFTGNFINTEFLENALSGVDTLVHVAGITTSNYFTDAAVKNHIRRMVLVHTTGIYSRFKAAGEVYRNIDDYVYAACKEHNIILTICRPTMIYGNITDNNIITFVKMVDRLPIMPVVNGAKYELQPVHYTDLGKAFYKILVNEEITANKDYILSGGHPIMLRDIFIEIGKNLGKKTRFLNCPFPLAYAGAWMIYLISFKKIDYRERVQRLCEPRTFSYEDAQKDFGYSPMDFEQGIVDEVKEYLNSKN